MFRARLPVLSASVLPALLLAGCAPKAASVPPGAAPAGLVYPDARQAEVVDTFYGTEVPDPYRWLEEPDSPETRAWVDAQVALTTAHLDAIDGRGAIRERVTELWNVERYGTPWTRGDNTFYFHNNGLQPHSVLYVTPSLDAEPRVLLDPDTLSDDGTRSLGGLSVSWDGTLLAYAVSDGGSDWRTWHLRDIATGEDLEDTVSWAKFSGADWAPDNSGFFYSRYPEPENPLEQVNEFQSVWFHKVGTPQSEDVLVFEDREHPRRGHSVSVPEEGDRIFLYDWEGTEDKNRLYTWTLAEGQVLPEGDPTPLFTDFDAEYSVLHHDGETLWVKTNDHPNGRVFQTTLADTQVRTDILAPAEQTLRGASVVGDTLFGVYLQDGAPQPVAFGLDGTRKDLQLETRDGVSYGGFTGKRSDTHTWYTQSSYTQPTEIYRYDLTSGESTLWKRPDTPFDSDDYVSTLVRVTSKDGTAIPLTLTHHRDVTPNGEQPTLLYGYGGFNITLSPRYRSDVAAWLELGGVWAVANLRGGGEYGAEWHEAGTQLTKQNVFDDFIASAEWLIDNGWTRPDRLAINGRSNGGLLVGAVLTQRPDLFGAALPGVGVMDMLRYHKFTIGWAWASDYGTVDDSEEMFNALLAYSPVHNTTAGTCYPATLVHTADHDDRVVPGHSYKFAAALQRDQSCDEPALIRIETRAGHGAGMSTDQQIAQAADLWTFLVDALDFEPQGLASDEAAAE